MECTSGYYAEVGADLRALTLSMPMAKTEKLIPIRLHSTPPARVLLGSEVAIELPVESIAGLLQALKDKGLLHAAP